jgi:hypothetical protein
MSMSLVLNVGNYIKYYNFKTVLCSLRIEGCIQKFPDWPRGARTANGAALCH